MNGSIEPYLKKLRHYAGGIPLLSADYGSSEGWIGAHVNPTRTPEMGTFVVLPSIGYFEFIPLREVNVASPDHAEHGSELVLVEPRPVGLTDVEVGVEYEVVVTNFTGLEGGTYSLNVLSCRVFNSSENNENEHTQEQPGKEEDAQNGENNENGHTQEQPEEEDAHKVWRGKWGPMVAESGEGGGWEEEVRWCDGGERD
ncbi:jasmonic acid-amido synthetase JAR1-like protein [Tanacetum coccineum]